MSGNCEAWQRRLFEVAGIISRGSDDGIEWNRKWDGLIPAEIHSWQDSFFDPLGTTMAVPASVSQHIIHRCAIVSINGRFFLSLPSYLTPPLWLHGLINELVARTRTTIVSSRLLSRRSLEMFSYSCENYEFLFLCTYCICISYRISCDGAF